MPPFDDLRRASADFASGMTAMLKLTHDETAVHERALLGVPVDASCGFRLVVSLGFVERCDATKHVDATLSPERRVTRAELAGFRTLSGPMPMSDRLADDARAIVRLREKLAPHATACAMAMHDTLGRAPSAAIVVPFSLTCGCSGEASVDVAAGCAHLEGRRIS